MNIIEVIRRETAGFENRIALRESGRELSYAALWDHMARLAQDLKPLAGPSFPRVGIRVQEGMDYVLLNLALLSLRAVVVPVPAAASENEVMRLREEMKLDFLISESDAGEAFFSLMSPVGKNRWFVFRFNACLPEQREFEALNPAFIRFTSGTTGQSKGVVISHEAMDARTRLANQVFQITPQDVVIWVLPMTHHFVATIPLFLRCGATLVLCRQEGVSGMAPELRHGDATFIYAAPLHYEAMVAAPAIPRDNVSRIRMAVSTTMPLSESLAHRFQEKFGFALSSAYGIIEAGLPFIQPAGTPASSGAVGYLVPGYEVCLRVCGENEEGAVCVRGPGLFDAYFYPWQRHPENAWFDTGDIGRMDVQGRLFLLGRTRQVINYMGMKIFPSEVQAVLESFPGIEEAFVDAEPHELYGQVPRAKVVWSEDDAFDETALRRFCYEHLSAFKVPKKFERVSVLKKTGSGKVMVDQ